VPRGAGCHNECFPTAVGVCVRVGDAGCIEEDAGKSSYEVFVGSVGAAGSETWGVEGRFTFEEFAVSTTTTASAITSRGG
jgi:hypothetical protein